MIVLFTGFEKEVGSATSKCYNANVRRMVAHISMLEYLKNPPEGFEEIVKTHFRLKARYLRKQLDKWLEEDDGKQLYSDSMSAAMALRRATTSSSGGAAAGAAAAAASPAVATFATPTSTTVPAGSEGASAGSSVDSVTTGTSSEKACSSKATTAFAKDIEEIKKLLDKLEMEE